MNNKIKPVLFLLPLLLTSCMSQVKEVYDKDTFHTQDFAKNYYREFNDKLKTDKYREKVFELKNGVDYNKGLGENVTAASSAVHIIRQDIMNNLISIEKVVELYGTDQAKAIKIESYPSEANYYLDIMENKLDNVNYFNVGWRDYAKANNLVTTAAEGQKEDFKRGVFSKLTDTIIACDGTGSLVRVQLDETGFSKNFKHELIEFPSLVLALRGGTNIDYHARGIERIRTSEITLDISFYVEQGPSQVARKTTFRLDIDDLHTDNNASTNTNMIQINFKDILKTTAEIDLIKRTTAISVNFTLDKHEILKPNEHTEKNEEDLFGLMLYEIMLPYSTWN